MQIVTTSDLVQEVRDLTFEANTVSPTDDALVRMMNRGQRFIVSQLVAIYPEALLVKLDLGHVTGPIDIPKDAFEDRVLSVEFVSGAQPYRIPWRRFDQTAALRMSGVTVPVPYAVYTLGRQIFFAGNPSGQYTCSLYYVKYPEPLVLAQGRITRVNAADGYVVVDQVGDAVTTESNDLASYVNIVDHQTAQVKGTFQVASLPSAGNRVNLRDPPARTLVQGRTILPSTSLDDVLVAEDDYVCGISGSCIPMLGSAFNSFLVEYAAAELNRALGAEQLAQLSGQISEVYRRLAEQQDAGRGTPIRIRNTSKIWSRLSPFRFLPGMKG